MPQKAELPISPLYLPTSPLHLAYISPIWQLAAEGGARVVRVGGVERDREVRVVRDDPLGRGESEGLVRVVQHLGADEGKLGLGLEG